jgi:glycosyltransferase involved in cell wall biosynthesis
LKFGFNPDEFLVMYTGSFGYKQNLSNLISAAECLRNDVDIRFLCIGGGHQEQYLIDKVKTFSNISLLPPVPGSEFSHLLKAADILVLTERATIRAMSLPSKLTSYFMANRPVLAAISNESATYRFAGKYMYVVDPDNPLALSEGIKYLKNNPMFCSNLAKYAQNFAEEVMSSTVGRRAYLGSIGEVISRNLSGE